MAKRRRKLSGEMEQEISSAKRKVELITAIINDIRDEQIQDEYLNAFLKVSHSLAFLAQLYKEYGFNDDSESALVNYKSLLEAFENEYEI